MKNSSKKIYWLTLCLTFSAYVHADEININIEKSNVIMLLPSTSEEYDQEWWDASQAWREKKATENLTVAALPFHKIMEAFKIGSQKNINPELIRLYLREHVNYAVSADNGKARYLAIVGPEEGNDVENKNCGNQASDLIFCNDFDVVDGALAGVPRYQITTDYEPSEVFSTEALYSFLEPEVIGDGYGAGNISTTDIDFTHVDLHVFRWNVQTPDELHTQMDKALQYLEQEAARDLTLVAGQITFDILGDTAAIQCLNARSTRSARHITTAFDIDAVNVKDIADALGLGIPVPNITCESDYHVNSDTHRFAHYINGDQMADDDASHPDDSYTYQGGVIYNISHGDTQGIYAIPGGDSIVNLGKQDILGLSDTENYTIYAGLACSSDQQTRNLPNFANAWMQRNGVAVIAASRTTAYQNFAVDITVGEMTFTDLFFDQNLPLIQALQGVRSAYYIAIKEYCTSLSTCDYAYAINNLLAMNVYGDGTIVLP